MCDCYVDYCADCKRPIPMHLGDFRTKRYEIQVFCEDCWKWVNKELYDGKRITVWKIGDAREEIKKKHPALYEQDKEFVGKKVIVVALTRNAQKNREINYPNLILQMEMEEM